MTGRPALQDTPSGRSKRSIQPLPPPHGRRIVDEKGVRLVGLAVSRPAAAPPRMSWTRALLACGAASSLLYLGTDLVASLRSPGYSYISQAVSELSAVGAPSRQLVVPLYALYDLLVIAFGIGVRRRGGEKPRLRLVGALLVAYGVLGLAWYFFPMDMRGAQRSLTDTMHIVFTGAAVLLMALYIGFAGAAEGRRFLVYSLATIAVLLLFGVWAGVDAPRLAAGLPTPWLGIKERVSVYAPIAWVLVFAVDLLRPSRTVSR